MKRKKYMSIDSKSPSPSAYQSTSKEAEPSSKRRRSGITQANVATASSSRVTPHRTATSSSGYTPLPSTSSTPASNTASLPPPSRSTGFVASPSASSTPASHTASLPPVSASASRLTGITHLPSGSSTPASHTASLPPPSRPRTTLPSTSHSQDNLPLPSTSNLNMPSSKSSSRATSTSTDNSDPLNLNKPGLLTRVYANPHGVHDPKSDQYIYGPTKLPPEPWKGESPFRNREGSEKMKSVPVSAVEFIPILERRVESVERAVDGYMGVRASQALQRASIPPARYGEPSLTRMSSESKDQSSSSGKTRSSTAKSSNKKGKTK